MKLSFLISLVLTVLGLYFSGCASVAPQVSGDFVKSVSFSPFDTFQYKHTLMSGMDWRSSEKYMTEALSERVLSQELIARGFEHVDAGGDFYIVSKWRKRVSSTSGVFDHIDGPTRTIHGHRNASFSAAVRYTLIVEIYQSVSHELFWRAELSNLFDAIEYTETRVVASLKRAIRNFPNRSAQDLTAPTVR
jgi:hypothetical protein